MARVENVPSPKLLDQLYILQLHMQFICAVVNVGGSLHEKKQQMAALNESRFCTELIEDS